MDLFIIFRCTIVIFWSGRNGCGWKHCKIMAGQHPRINGWDYSSQKI